jgi:hypothetical protein
VQNQHLFIIHTYLLSIFISIHAGVYMFIPKWKVTFKVLINFLHSNVLHYLYLLNSAFYIDFLSWAIIISPVTQHQRTGGGLFCSRVPLLVSLLLLMHFLLLNFRLLNVQVIWL